MKLLLAAATAASLLAAEPPNKRPIRFSDVPAALRGSVAGEADFDALLRSIEKRTTARLEEGERDHLIYYLLQSRRFTSEPPIEPALSAREFVKSGKTPAEVTRRIADFLRARGGDDRFVYFRKIAPPDLAAEYARAMRFLYEKEFVVQPKTPAERAAALARLYQQRGHSSDTKPEANIAVKEALAVLKALEPGARLHRVLIVGPGLDFAPRTGFRDDIQPQSYQPFAVADTLLKLGLAERARLRIHCVDINERVVGHLKTRGVSADRLNIITERYEPSPGYDLVVVTNVLTYFDQTELGLALVNIQAMMRPAGYLIHNELRQELEPLAGAVGLEAVQGRTVRLSADLLDAFVIHKNR